jgi:enolase
MKCLPASNMAIIKFYARSVYDSRGTPTVEVDIVTETRLRCTIVASGASTGFHEVREPPGCEKSHCVCNGVTEPAGNANDIFAATCDTTIIQQSFRTLFCVDSNRLTAEHPCCLERRRDREFYLM